MPGAPSSGFSCGLDLRRLQMPLHSVIPVSVWVVAVRRVARNPRVAAEAATAVRAL